MTQHYQVAFIRSRMAQQQVFHSWAGVNDWVFNQMLEDWDALTITCVRCECPQSMIDAEPVPVSKVEQLQQALAAQSAVVDLAIEALEHSGWQQMADILRRQKK